MLREILNRSAKIFETFSASNRKAERKRGKEVFLNRDCKALHMALPQEKNVVSDSHRYSHPFGFTEIFFLIFCATLPFQFAINPTSTIDLHLSRLFIPILFLVWAGNSLLRRSFFLPLTKETLLLSLFLFLSAFSLLFTEQREWGMRKLFFLLSFFPLFLVATALFRNVSFLTRAFSLLFWGGALSAIAGIVQSMLPFFLGLDPTLSLWHRFLLPFFSGRASAETISNFSSMVVNVGGFNFLRASAFFPDPHIAAFFWGMLLPFGVLFTFHSRGRQRVFFAMGTLALILADLLTFSRGGLFALLGTFLIFFFISLPLLFRKYSVLVFLILFLGGIFLLVPNPFSLRLFSSINESDHSVSGRIAIFHEALDIVREHPILGVGLGNYSNTVKPSADYREPRYAHNLFLDISAETGLPTGIIFFTFLFFLLKTFFSREAHPILRASGYSLLLFSLHALFETPLYSVHILPFLILLMAVSSARFSFHSITTPQSKDSSYSLPNVP